jgi:hypothetical protein
LALQLFDLGVICRPGRVALEPGFASFHEVLHPGVVNMGMNAFAAAKLRHRDLAFHAFQHDADLVFGRVFLLGAPLHLLDEAVCALTLCHG